MYQNENREIEVNKTKLIETLYENKSKHIKEYNESITAWRDNIMQAVDKIKEKIQESPDVDPTHLISRIRKPHNHSDQYNTVIGMMEMDVKENVTISQSDYMYFIKDEWDWKRDFAATYASNISNKWE